MTTNPVATIDILNSPKDCPLPETRSEARVTVDLYLEHLKVLGQIFEWGECTMDNEDVLRSLGIKVGKGHGAKFRARVDGGIRKMVEALGKYLERGDVQAWVYSHGVLIGMEGDMPMAVRRVYLEHSRAGRVLDQMARGTGVSIREIYQRIVNGDPSLDAKFAHLVRGDKKGKQTMIAPGRVMQLGRM